MKTYNYINFFKTATVLSLFLMVLSCEQANKKSSDNEDKEQQKTESVDIRNAALNYAKFWNTGEEKYARKALCEKFKDMTPPEGRKPGIEGVLEASKNFRKIVPNLKAEVEHLLVSGKFVTVRYRFKGNFTGEMNDTKGQGQTIDFPAVDIYEINDGKIVKNWHLEDYNTFFSQIK